MELSAFSIVACNSATCAFPVLISKAKFLDLSSQNSVNSSKTFCDSSPSLITLASHSPRICKIFPIGVASTAHTTEVHKYTTEIFILSFGQLTKAGHTAICLQNLH